GQATKKRQCIWNIRQAMSPQLEELWSFKPALQGESDQLVHWEQTWVPDHGNQNVMRSTVRPKSYGQPADRRALLRQPDVIDGLEYLPLVRSELHLSCTIDILFLRNGDPGSIISNAGDLDNRIKNLFDGLRVPEDNDQRPPDVGTGLIYCLLEDD